MAFDAVTREMYCPKCKENFEEGSRRFCPTDGRRLVSEETGEAENERGGGIFANLIPKIDAAGDMDETLSDVPRFVVTEPSRGTFAETEKDDSAFFFEVGESEPDLAAEAEFLKQSETALRKSKPAARKVNPYEIPAGHVDLGDATRPGAVADFDEEDPESFVGRTVKGRYEVMEFLGGDESGLAFLAEDKIVEHKKVLVRILLEGEFDEIIDSILAEERVSLSHFSHPNIARLFDSGQFTDGTNFLISEYIDALSVRDILNINGPFSSLRAARIVRQAAYGLTEAHQDGILHRDLRPENLIIDASESEIEQTKLVNFGASNGDPNERNLAYKAPEVLDGRVSTIAGDVYALGVIAYEMLTNKKPFSGSGPKEMLRSQRSGLLGNLTNLRPDLPPVVDEIIEKALSFDAAARYAQARDFGDAFFNALTNPAHPRPSATMEAVDAEVHYDDIKIEPEIPALVMGEVRVSKPVEENKAVVVADEPAWKSRSPEPPKVENSRTRLIALTGLIALAALIAAGWYYVVNNPLQPDVPLQADQTVGPNTAPGVSPAIVNTEMPPMPRSISQQPNTNFYQNSKQNLKGDLLRNFVGFTLYYPKDWKINDPQEGTTPNARGKFLDISGLTPDGRLKEQMLVSYYPSKGTFADDADKFEQMVRETNDTLKKILPGYQMVSQGEIKLNGDWRAFEVKFQGGGTSGTGEKLVVWGRRLFIPAARPGVRNGFEITMLATSLADDVRSVDDIGVRGELAAILYSFEPSQNF